MVINQRGSTFIYKQHSSRCSNTHEVNNNSHTHTHNSNYKWQRYITLITYLLTYNSRDAAHISGPQPHPHASTYTHTHTQTYSCRNWITDQGFMPTSTTHIDSTVLYHITHEQVNLYECEKSYLSTCYEVCWQGVISA